LSVLEADVPDEPPDLLSPAITTVVARFTRLLRHVAFRRGLSADDVEEVIQEVRVRLWRARPTGETIRTLGVSYVYRTAVSAALEVVRRRRVGAMVGSGTAADETAAAPELIDAAASPHAGPDDLLAQSELAREISEAARTLSGPRRVVVQMHLVGYTRDEMASVLGWSEAKVRNLLYRGLADLRAELHRRGIGPGEVT
jgi:RNA polymerase sigma factor (sigma-70 family)